LKIFLDTANIPSIKTFVDMGVLDGITTNPTLIAKENREFVELVTKLWESWDADAIVMDRKSGVFVDPTKVRVIDFKGRFFSSRGPLNTARPPQGRPVLIQAGGSPQGRQLAAKHMDCVVAALGTVEEMKAFRADLLRQLRNLIDGQADRKESPRR